MREYLINFIDIEGHSVLVTLLNYENRISDELSSIRIPSEGSRTVLADTALVAGMGKYRFIQSTLNQNGMFEFEKYEYVQCSSKVENTANQV